MHWLEWWLLWRRPSRLVPNHYPIICFAIGQADLSIEPFHRRWLQKDYLEMLYLMDTFITSPVTLCLVEAPHFHIGIHFKGRKRLREIVDAVLGMCIESISSVLRNSTYYESHDHFLSLIRDSNCPTLDHFWGADYRIAQLESREGVLMLHFENIQQIAQENYHPLVSPAISIYRPGIARKPQERG